jgi:hypothetical protein
MDKLILAAEAQRIKENDAARHALSLMRAGALDDIMHVDPADAESIRTLQATVRVIDEFFDRLDAFIREGVEKKPAGLA